jgi:four helix bundle protein
MSNKIQMKNDQKAKGSIVINRKYDIYQRVFDFTVRVVKFSEKLPKTFISTEYTRQLIRSSGSIGANLEEADGALTKRDFINKVGISRRETRETRHWLKLIQATMEIQEDDLNVETDWLIGECSEILLILSSIIKNSSNRK